MTELTEEPQPDNPILKEAIEALREEKSFNEILDLLAVDVRAAEYMLNKKAFKFEAEILADPEEGFLRWQPNHSKKDTWQIFYKNLPEQLYKPYRELESENKLKLAKHLPVLLYEVKRGLAYVDSVQG